MRDRLAFEKETALLRPMPVREYQLAPMGPLAMNEQTVGFEFDVHYGFVPAVVSNAGKTYPTDGDEVTTHSYAADFFKVKRDGPRLEIATKPFKTSAAGEKEIGTLLKNVAGFAGALRNGCGKAKPLAITVPGVAGQPRPFDLPSARDPGMPVVKLPLNKKFDAQCGVWASPQATLTLSLGKVSALVTAIRKSEGGAAGVGLTGRKGQRLGVRSDAIYRAQAAVAAMRSQLLGAKPKLKALKDRPIDEASFTDALSGLLILLASYLITSELPHQFDSSKKLFDYERFAKAFLPLNVKTPFPQIFGQLLDPQERAIMRELFVDGAARARLFSLAKSGATLKDGDNLLFPPGRKVNGLDSVHEWQKAEFGAVPTWNDLVEHMLDDSHKGWGSRLLVPISKPITIDKTFPRIAVEMRRIGFASVFDTQWPGLVRRILKIARTLS